MTTSASGFASERTQLRGAGFLLGSDPCKCDRDITLRRASTARGLVFEREDPMKRSATLEHAIEIGTEACLRCFSQIGTFANVLPGMRYLHGAWRTPQEARY